MNEQKTSIQIALELSKVNSFYGELQVLREISIKINKSEVVALFGPNGHGKSTLLKSISGILQPASGSIKYYGTEISKYPTHKIVETGLSLIPEERFLFPYMTVKENLTLGAYNSNARPKLKENLNFVYEVFPVLGEREHQISFTLSGGEARMLAVGRGLMSGSSFLMIDEPSIGLSPIMKKGVFESIQKINKSKHITILIVEQEIEDALWLANRVYLLKNGHIVFEESAEKIDRSEIEKAYF